jgi:LPXTG-site transpeptidase (sortase) family protein
VTHKLSRIFLLFSWASFLVSGYFIYERYYDPQRLAFFGHVPTLVSTSGVLPIRIAIPDLQINLPIVPASLSAQRWPTTSQGVSYLLSSSLPGVGNSVYYGHNWPRLLGPLTRAQIGQQLIITTSDGRVQHYYINQIQHLTSSAVDILDPSSDPRITLYTCEGLFDSKRLVITATL